MSFTELLQLSCEQYTSFYNDIVTAVGLSYDEKFHEVSYKIKEMNALFAEIQTTDKKLYSVVNEGLIEADKDLWQQRKKLIKKTLAFHADNLPHLRSIAAIKKAELEKIRSGIRGTSGYHTGIKQTGKLLKHSS